jgi:hypothetical protein
VQGGAGQFLATVNTAQMAVAWLCASPHLLTTGT